MATQITDTGGGTNTDAMTSVKPAAREGKINGYPSFRMDIAPRLKVIRKWQNFQHAEAQSGLPENQH